MLEDGDPTMEEIDPLAVRATISPSRRPANAATRTMTRKRGSIASAISKTCGIEAIGRSGEVSCPAPVIAHGLRRMRSSATAVARIVCRSRQHLATDVRPGLPARSIAACHARTLPGVSFASSTSPSAGRMCSRSWLS